MSDCRPIVSRKFIKTGSTEFDVLMGDGSVKDIRDLETFHGEHTILGTTIPTVTLLRFLESWGSFTNTGSSVYIKMTDTIIPDGETGIGDIPLGKSLIITYRVDCQTLMWVHADNGAVYKYRNNIWSVDSVNPAIYIATSEIGNTVPGLIDGLLDPSVIPNLPSEIVYGFTFDDLLLLDTKQGDILYIDLNTRIQYYWDDTSFVPYGTVVDFATKAEAESGTVIAKVMSPKTTKDAIEYHKATANILGSSTLNATSTNNTGTSTKTARQDHSHKVEGFSLVNHTHDNVLLHRPSTGDIVGMSTGNVIDINATTFKGKTPTDFATSIQGRLADTSVQNVTLGGITKKIGNTAVLPSYPINTDFKLRDLNDVPKPIVANKILVTTDKGDFVFKDYTTTRDYVDLTNKPTISINAVSPTKLDLTPQTLNGNLVLHPIARFGTLTTLSDVDSDPAPAENNILQYKNGIWTPSVPSGFDLKGLLFDTSGEGECCGAAYDGRTDLTISYNSIGASPLNHNHNLVNLNDVTVTDVRKDQILVYNGSKWVNELKTNISSLTFNNGGQGASSIAVYNGASPKTISYNTIGAAPLNHNHNLDTIGQVTITNPLPNQLLQYSNGAWVNRAVDGLSNFIYDIAFVDKDGDDTTGQVGNINQPFATLQAAMTAASALSDCPLIHVMSDLTINSSITIPNLYVTINLYNGITITFTNINNSESLFNCISSKSFTITGNATIICYSTESYLCSFMTDTGGGRILLKGITIKHYINPFSLSTIFTIFATNSNLEIQDCNILTNNQNTGILTCSNIKISGKCILDINDSKLALINEATGGTSRHIIDIDTFPKTSLINCKTIQILPNFVNPTEDPTSSYTTSWHRIGVAGAETNRLTTNYTISNCIFYINNVVQTRLNSSWVRFKVWPNTKWYIDMYSGGRPESLAHVFQIVGYDNIEYLGTSLHNYGKTFGHNEIASPPTQHGGVFATSLIRCDLNQPFELLM